MSRLADRTVIGLSISAVVLMALAALIPNWMLFIFLQSFARGAVALGLLVLWRSGLISFGHALYFAAGAYGAVFMQRMIANDAFAMVAAGLIASGALAFLLGFLLRQYRGIFFALLNMAFSMVLWGLLAKTEALGSTDGLSIVAPRFFGMVFAGDQSKLAIYFFAIVLTWMFSVAVHLYMKSTLGAMSTAVRENEIRLEYLGYSAHRAVHVKYVISALLAGFGGVLMGMTVGIVDPDSMAYWTVSGEFVFITILSGTGNVAATYIGAFVFEIIRSLAFQYSPKLWQLIMGGALLLIIMFLPNGLWSVMARLRKARAS
ncbi:MAG: branched-chain amino acid ABC transporter permease [Betaproteobacteria bacterium]|nr:branched-chain amino acid ABC transporter permease [Betaproteobacteria bacterium]